ncbi:TetR/AcrR family transcriptional regulator [Enterococcus sp. AZ163]|uniref:TetR/AcrR family transcriptional regulator n=1 Tax=Enterococcus sp. AZ163 TaxID=2774638 RepID=UPI003D2E2C46
MRKEEATRKTTALLTQIARRHFTQYGYHSVSLEKIAEEGQVTRGAVYHHFKNKQGLFLAVLDHVQQDVAAQIEKNARTSDDPWQQLILGCIGFIKGANALECRRILLVDAPAVVGWDAWRKADQENSMNSLQQHLMDLKAQNYLTDEVNPVWITHALSGALNEMALNYPAAVNDESDQMIVQTVTRLVAGFKKM